MPFAAVTLKPGVNVEPTATALRAGYAASNLGRFRSGFFEKLGGWVKYYGFALAGVPRALQAWLDINGGQWLGVGTTQALDAINSGILYNITPQTVTTNFAPKFTTNTTPGTADQVIVDDSGIANVTVLDSIEFLTPVSVGGIILSGVYPIDANLGTTTYRIIAATDATSIVTNGGAVPVFTPTSGSALVSVALNSHGLSVGGAIVFPLATVVGGVTIRGTYSAVSITNANTFVIAITSTASNSTPVSMNSGNCRLNYYLTIGPVGATGTAYSVGTYSSGPYSGTGATSGQQTGTNITASDWTLDNWNDRLVACSAYDGVNFSGIYTWQPTGGNQNAQLIAGNGAPLYNSGIFVAAPRLALVAFGSTVTKDIGIAQDPLVYKISDIGDYNYWLTNTVNPTTGDTSQAFESRLPTGTAIKAGLAAPNQLLLWTDLDCWCVNYVNLPTIWTQSKIGANCGTISRHGVAQMAGVIYWWGRNNFYAMAGGAPAVIPCTVWDSVFQNLNSSYVDKCFIETVTAFSEIWFFYPSSASTGQCDSYAKVNVIDGAWDYGALPRSIGIDQSVVGNPIMATPTGILYSHETGFDADGQQLVPYFQTGEFYLSEGQDFVFCDSFYPDFHLTTFDGSTTPATVQVTFAVKDYPGDTPRSYGPYNMTTDTLKLDIRFRGRMFQISMTSTDVGSWFRLGKPYFRIASSGRR